MMGNKLTSAVRTELFDIENPALNLSTVSSDISILESENGQTIIEIDVTVLNLDVTTVSGDVAIRKNPTTHCIVKTVSGDVIAHTYSGCEYSLKSVSGDMNSEILLDADSDSTFKSAGAVSISASTVSVDFMLARN